MRPKRSRASIVFELLAVLLLTAAAFVWGMQTARIERGCNAIGGEHLLLLLPAIYYTGKRTILDWIADFRKLRRGDKPPSSKENRPRWCEHRGR